MFVDLSTAEINQIYTRIRVVLLTTAVIDSVLESILTTCSPDAA